jgi:acyl-CoA synthetase (NDP forming)
MNPQKDLDALLNPRSIAVVGASEKIGAGSQVINNLKTLGFSGTFIPVNPKYKTVSDLRCYPSLSDIPPEIAVDCVAVVLGAGTLLAVLKQAAERGIRGAWAFASGFAETGKAGRALQAELKSFCDANGIAFCGPNCVGYLNLHRNVGTFSAPVSPTMKKGNIAAVVQSGSVALALANSNRGIGFSTLVSSGNEAVLDAVDYIEYFLQDDHTRVIIAFLEGIRRPEAFRKVCIQAVKANKPIIAVKVGRSEMARKTVVTHTGALAGSDAVHDAFFAKYGVIRVDDLDQLMETAAIFSSLANRLPRGNRVGMLTVSGGEIGLVGDLSRRLALSFPPLSSQAIDALKQKLPPYTTIANPLDAWGSGDLENVYPACLEILAQEKNVDIIAVSQDSPPGMSNQQVQQYTAVAKAAVRCAAGKKPVMVFSHVSGGLDPTLKSILDGGGVPFLQGTRESLRALDHLAAYAGFKAKGLVDSAAVGEGPPNLREAASRMKLREGVLSYQDSKTLLQIYGIKVPLEAVVYTAEEALETAREIGYPLVMKGSSQAVAHKTEAGLVQLNIHSDAQLQSRFEALKTNMQSQAPEAPFDGVLVQQMISLDAVETILGINHDPVFGPAVVLGLGGVLVELLQDFQLGLPPLSRSDAMEMIRSLKGYRILTGYRGKPAADIEALADTVVQIAQMAIDFKDVLTSLDLNPLMVLPEGQGVVAVDVLMECAGPVDQK